MRTALGALATFLLTSGTLVMAADYEGPVKHYQPKLDITVDPGCGKKLKTKEERIEHNRKLAELYFLNFQEYYKRGKNFGWDYWKCLSPESTILLGGVEPLADPHVGHEMMEKFSPPSKTAKQPDPSALNPEELGYLATFETYGTIPGTLAVVPFEGGAYFRMMYGGKGKDDGKDYPNWETDFILVDDNGRITHFEMWNDTLGWDRANRKAFGIPLDEVHGMDGYISLLIKRLQERQQQGQQTNKPDHERASH